MDNLEQVLRYHQETKHNFFRFARGPGYMDWANQPDPFRRFEGAPLVPLPILRPDEPPLTPSYADLYRHGAVATQPMTLRSVSRFFEYALSLTAWKQAGDVRWPLRSNPSSGNLHPTEGYAFIGPIQGLSHEAGLYHYAPKEHALELRAAGTAHLLSRLMEAFPPGAFLFGLTSIHWREAWKYGERAFRYCQHDIGHAIGSARIAAAVLGWEVLLLDEASDDQLARLLGLDRDEDFEGAEREHPECLCVVGPSLREDDRSQPDRRTLLLNGLDQAVAVQWHGKANRLSSEHAVDWEIIEIAAEASWKSRVTQITKGETERLWSGDALPLASYPGNPSAGQIIHQRRSALAFDGKTSITDAEFYLMLGRVLPYAEQPVPARPVPWDAIPWEPTIHLGLFVHRVVGLSPGLYVLVRDPARREALQQAMQGTFEWAQSSSCPKSLPLYRLQEGDARNLAAQVSCGQDIAGDSAFSLGMIAEFEGSLRRHGPWFYRRLFWEAGVIGQVLYLEAEAAGVRATGIGCYFDDPVHQAFGLKDATFQSLYHFTTGGPVEDARLTTLPPYGHKQ